MALRDLHARGTLPIEPLGGCVAQVEISRWAFGDVGIVLGKLGGLRQVVPPHASEYRDEVFLGVNIAGMAVASQGGQELSPRTGDAVLFSSAEAGFTSSRPRPSQFLGLRLPHRIACATGPRSRPGVDAADTELHPLFAIDGRLSLLARFETGPEIGWTRPCHLNAYSRPHRSERRCASRRGGGGPGPRGDARRDCTRSRRMSRATSARGTYRSRQSPRATRSRRAISTSSSKRRAQLSLNMCSRAVWNSPTGLLTDLRLVGRSIASIAFDAGFSDLSHFNRMFRRRYNATPTEVRAAERS